MLERMSRDEPWPVTLRDVLGARARIRPHLARTPLRRYSGLDDAVGNGVSVRVKHENLNPTGSFKVRNAISAVGALPRETLDRGIVAATRGNHGLGVAYAGVLFHARVTICVPVGNNPEKNAGMRGLGATLVEEGKDYDECLAVAERLVREHGLHLVHSTNDTRVVAGAATISLEMLEDDPELDALVVSVGGGSQAVGALVVARALRPDLPVYAVQAERASAAHDSWHARRPIARESADTFADGLATRNVYDLTFPALCEGLTGFIAVSEAEIAEAIRILLRTTHTLVEGAGAAGLAGLLRLQRKLAGRSVAIVLSGGNIDAETLRRVVNREI